LRTASLKPRWFVVALALALVLPAWGADDASPPRTRVGPPHGKLFIVGGGNLRALWPMFIELAGGRDAPIVVIPTAGNNVQDPAPATRSLRTYGALNVTQLHTTDRATADSEEFAAVLRSARAVWISGGRQWRLANAYLGTRTLREIHALLARGGVVGGSSAGASIQASFLIRGSPAGTKIVMAPGHEEGFGFLRGAAIDQHANTRGRQDDIRSVLKKYPQLLGIVLDEATALVVAGDECEVVGWGKVRFIASPDADAVELSSGARYDLAARRPK